MTCPAPTTARAIAERTGCALHTTLLLHERSFGDWRGQPYASLSTDPLAMDAAPRRLRKRCNCKPDSAARW